MIAVANTPNSTLDLEPKIKLWTVAEYHHLSELGILNADGRTELINGQILLMAAKGTLHVIALQLLATSLSESAQINKIASIRTQDPIQLNDFSEPEPDLVVVKGGILDYAEHHPYPEDIHLVVEIADSTLKQDCQVKDRLYAQAGIGEYWVVDLKNRQVHIFRMPTATGYTNHLILKEPNEFSPLAFPELVLSVTSILPPVV
jgi:Uma2 family endonuclease